MDDLQRYRFDLTGYLVIPGMLDAGEVAILRAAVERLEARAEARWPRLAPMTGWHGMSGRRDDDDGTWLYGGGGHGGTWVIEDFWNADPAFDPLIGHPATVDLVAATIRGRATINNAEVRIRYPGNATGAHMGGPIDAKYAYRHDGRGFDCMMTRMIYFLHDVAADDGAFCVVPGSHKAAYPPPPAADVASEIGMVPLPVRAGDAIWFTEALRHGGVVNRGARPRLSLHVGYGPAWMRAQHFGCVDEPQFLTERTWTRLTAAQREWFTPWPAHLRPQPRAGRAAALRAE